MSRQCSCRSRCRHYVRSSADALLTPERLTEMAGILATLVDAADAYDSDSLQIDPECGIHGYRAVSNAECVCVGDRYTAAEFIQTLMLDVRSATRFENGHRPRRQKDGRMSLAVAG